MAQDAPRVVRDLDHQKIILGVDRLDYTKGLVNRLKAFELLLVKHPNILNKLFLCKSPFLRGPMLKNIKI